MNTPQHLLITINNIFSLFLLPILSKEECSNSLFLMIYAMKLFRLSIQILLSLSYSFFENAYQKKQDFPQDYLESMLDDKNYLMFFFFLMKTVTFCFVSFKTKQSTYVTTNTLTYMWCFVIYVSSKLSESENILSHL